VEFPERRDEIRSRTGGFTAEGALTGTGAETPLAGRVEDVPMQRDAPGADQEVV
jgi:hypothetical protein